MARSTVEVVSLGTKTDLATGRVRYAVGVRLGKGEYFVDVAEEDYAVYAAQQSRPATPTPAPRLEPPVSYSEGGDSRAVFSFSQAQAEEETQEQSAEEAATTDDDFIDITTLSDASIVEVLRQAGVPKVARRSHVLKVIEALSAEADPLAQYQLEEEEQRNLPPVPVPPPVAPPIPYAHPQMEVHQGLMHQRIPPRPQRIPQNSMGYPLVAQVAPVNESAGESDDDGIGQG